MLHRYLFQVVICLSSERYLKCQMNVPIAYRNHPEIKKLYNGRVCTEISVETGGACTDDQNCVMPNTPGNISSVCPNQVDNMFSSRIQTRKRKRKKGASTERKKKVTKGKGRLIGTSTLPLRYPWTCSLKTRGYRC